MGTAHEQVGGKKESCHGLVQLLQVCRSGKSRNWSIRYLNERWNSAFVHERIFGNCLAQGNWLIFTRLLVSQSFRHLLSLCLSVLSVR